MNREKTAKALVEPEGDRRSTEGSTNANKVISFGIDPEVDSCKRRKRKFTKEYKLKILKETDEATKQGQIGDILRREGLYYSTISYWRRQLDSGKLDKKCQDKKEKVISGLSKQNRKLQRELNQARLIIDAQKKILQIFESEE